MKTRYGNPVKLLASVLMAGFLIASPSLPVSASGKGCPSSYDEWDSPACDDGNPIDGYWWQGKEWVPGLVRNSTWFMEPPPVVSGKAAWYAPGVMEATAEVRGLSLDGYLDGVSTTTCADVGLDYWIAHVTPEKSYRDVAWEGPFLVVDCARRGDVYGVVVAREEVVEVGFDTAERWGLTQSHIYGGYHVNDDGWFKHVIVSKVPPAYAVYFEPVPFDDYFAERAEFYPLALEVTLDPRPIYRAPSTWRIDGVNWTTFVQPDWRRWLRLEIFMPW